MIDMGDLLSLGQMAGPAVAAYVSCRVGITQALQRAQTAEKEARRANGRIDHLFQLMHIRKGAA